MSNYETLVNILDQIRKEAPAEYKFYYPLETDVENLNKARSRAFIHLYLKVKFGLLDFTERQHFVTDDIDDGGIDGYYIDEDNKNLCFIQSKFRTNEAAFEYREIQLQEILKMDVQRILDGETCYENGNEYNGKIQDLIKRIQKIPDIVLYKPYIVILANLTKITEPHLKKVVGGLPIEVFDFERSYSDLVFPVVTGTYYSARDVFVYLNLNNKSLGSRIRYCVETEFRNSEITVVFVPTIEIAKLMHKYRNSVLKYNPRSYLDLSTNPVNQQIAKTVREKETNEFALFNNGITLLSDQTLLTEQTGYKDIAQLKLTNPQIINGGQTAYTLSKIYEDELNGGDPDKCFQDKEVLLKIITFNDPEVFNADTPPKISLIESISKATNEQTIVTEADRKSNDASQIKIQEGIFSDYGFFYVRKRGEYYNGIKDGYIDRSKLVDREALLRISVACSGLPAQARRSSERQLFADDKLYSKVCDLERLRWNFFGYLCLEYLNQIQKKFDKVPNNRFGVINYGNAIRYGKLAVVSIASTKLDTEGTYNQLQDKSTKVIDKLLKQWLDFENHVSSLPHNIDYFRQTIDEETGTVRYEVNYDSYYKGRTLNKDLKEYFKVP